MEGLEAVPLPLEAESRVAELSEGHQVALLALDLLQVVLLANHVEPRGCQTDFVPRVL